MGKRIAIAAIGTMGDVQPFVALSLALMRRGHSVV
ncbi:glycosyltransferase, partial [Devosia sp.]